MFMLLEKKTVYVHADERKEGEKKINAVFSDVDEYKGN